MARTITVTGYTFKDAARLPRKLAPIVGKRLAELTEAKGQKLIDADVVKEARAAASPLHPLFEWDDSAAAEAYRLVQAQHLLRNIQIEFIDSGGSSGQMRAYAVVVEDDEQHYAPMVRVMTDRALREQVLATAERELDAFRLKYAGIKELFGLIVAIRAFKARRRKRSRPRAKVRG